MILNCFSGKFLRIFGFPLILTSLLLDVGFRNSEVLANKNLIPAEKDDLFLYRGMAATYYCLSSNAGVEFNTALGVAAATYVQVVEGKHGGLIKELGDTKLDKNQLFAGAKNQVLLTAMSACPEKVPEDVAKKVNNLLKENTKNNKMKNKKKK